MRKSNREITDLGELLAVMRQCQVCRVALFDEVYPYIIPMNFGFEAVDGRVALYFHCANEGKKLELMKRCNRAAFELDIPKRLLVRDKACACTMLYESVCGNGTLETLPDEEKLRGLAILMRQYSDQADFDFDGFDVKAVTVLMLTVNALTGKRLTKE